MRVVKVMEMLAETEPLGLPRGSVRAIISLIIISSAIVIYLVKGEVPDWLVSAFGTAYGFYFGSRKVVEK